MKKLLSFILLSISGVSFASATCISFGVGDFNVSTGCSGTGQLGSLLSQAQGLVGQAIPLLMGLAMAVFFWYLVQFIWKGAEDPKKHAEGMQGMVYSLIAIFVMVCIWGIIALMASILGIQPGGALNDFKLPGFK